MITVHHSLQPEHDGSFPRTASGNPLQNRPHKRRSLSRSRPLCKEPRAGSRSTKCPASRSSSRPPLRTQCSCPYVELRDVFENGLQILALSVKRGEEPHDHVSSHIVHDSVKCGAHHLLHITRIHSTQQEPLPFAFRAPPPIAGRVAALRGSTAQRSESHSTRSSPP